MVQAKNVPSHDVGINDWTVLAGEVWEAVRPIRPVYKLTRWKALFSVKFGDPQVIERITGAPT